MSEAASNTLKRILTKSFSLIIFILLAAVNLIPFIWGFITSVKSGREIFAYPPKLFGFEWSAEHYIRVFQESFARSMWITLFYAVTSIIAGLLIGLMLAYAIKRYDFVGKKLLFYMVICGIPLSIGSAALVIPNYVFFSKLGFINQPYTLVVLYAAYSMPMAVWIMIGGIEGIPIGIEEAMTIDGAHRAYIIFNMTPRLCLPSMASAALFNFIHVWNDYILSSVMVNSNALKPIQVSIYNYMGFFGREWGPLAASATAAVIPILIVFTFLGKMLISGLTAGAVKS